MIKKDKNDNWEITTKGQLYRLTSHPNFGIFAPSLAVLIAAIVFILNRELSTKPPTKKTTPKSKLQSYDSVSKSFRPVQHLDTGIYLKNDPTHIKQNIAKSTSALLSCPLLVIDTIYQQLFPFVNSLKFFFY